MSQYSVIFLLAFLRGEKNNGRHQERLQKFMGEPRTNDDRAPIVAKAAKLVAVTFQAEPAAGGPGGCCVVYLLTLGAGGLTARHQTAVFTAPQYISPTTL